MTNTTVQSILYYSGNMDENGQWNGMVKELVEKVYV